MQTFEGLKNSERDKSGNYQTSGPVKTAFQDA